MSKKKTFGKVLAKKARREAAKIGKGVAREGGRIIAGTIKGLLGAFSPFHKCDEVLPPQWKYNRQLFRRRDCLLQWGVQIKANDKEEQQQMTEESVRAVLRVNGKTFTPVAHNLSADKAEAKLTELKSKGVQAQVLFQTSRHKGRGFKNCELCKNAAENLSQRAAIGLVEEDHTNDAVAEPGNEEQ